MESGELGIFVDIWERDADPVEDLEAMLFEHLVRQDHDMVHHPDETIWEQCEPIVESIEKSLALMEQIKLTAYKDIEEIIEPRAKFDHYCDKAIYRAKNEVIKRTIIPRRKRIRIHGRKN